MATSKRKLLKIAFIAIPIALVIIFFYIASGMISGQIQQKYDARQSRIIYDRHGEIIAVEPNPAGSYARYSGSIPPDFAELLVQAEDKYFYRHPGINPFSILRSLTRRYTGGSLASSTITQQLIKILYENEFERTAQNKLTEAVYALSLETRLSKDEILKMYINSIYLGNNVQGPETASRLYFGKEAYQLSQGEMLQIISSIPNPSNANPFEEENISAANYLAKRLGISEPEFTKISNSSQKLLREDFNRQVSSPLYLELERLSAGCPGPVHLSIDADLSDKVREVARRQIDSMLNKDASHAAVVVIDLSSNELISIIGTPNPSLLHNGYQINMATQARPIGSTIKPILYAKGFEKGLRPYTIVDDREYKYVIDSGYAFYPKNYDYQYRGPVTLHYALANSLNVPAVKVLEYVGIDEFNDFLLNELNFKPIQDIGHYQLGIALGGLEMDLLSLSYYFTLLGHGGQLQPLYLCNNLPLYSPGSQADFSQQAKIFDPPYIGLVEKIITDRTTGIDQFGVKNNLAIQGATAAAKTGTSREYHDSWTIGYTPDFLVGVWVGNAQNAPMDGIPGEAGAGRIWNEVMQMLVYSEYNRGTKFNFDDIHEFSTDNGQEYGLPGDDYPFHRDLMGEDSLILDPHDGDIFLYQDGMSVVLKAAETADWAVNGQTIGKGSNVPYAPPGPGTYKISARQDDGRSQEIFIYIDQPE